jgi:anti-sigma regulatory factor (Ser/Thr protein kinase)
MTDQITLTIPREADFQRVAHLVLGGLAVRMNLTVENLEDLQLALDALLDRSEDDLDGHQVTVRMRLEDDALETVVGPLGARVLEGLAQDDGDGLGLRRVLESTVDDVRVEGDAVALIKKVARG